MTYDQLIQSLDNFTIPDLITQSLLILSLLAMVIPLYVISLKVKKYLDLSAKRKSHELLRLNNEDSSQEEKSLKCYYSKRQLRIDIPITLAQLLVLGLLICAACWAYNHRVYTLHAKQTQRIPHITQWENSTTMQSYIETLPTKRTTHLANPTEISQGYYKIATSIRGEKQTFTINSRQMFKIRKEQLRPSEPKKTYLEYVVLPRNITYNYKKNTILPLKLVEVW